MQEKIKRPGEKLFSGIEREESNRGWLTGNNLAIKGCKGRRALGTGVGTTTQRLLTSCGGPYKRVNSVLLAVNILRLRRSAFSPPALPSLSYSIASIFLDLPDTRIRHTRGSSPDETQRPYKTLQSRVYTTAQRSSRVVTGRTTLI